MSKTLSDKVEEWSHPLLIKKQFPSWMYLKKTPPNWRTPLQDLEFGTGGMRGIMGVGTNRINAYTLGKSTQGLSDYLKRVFTSEQIKVVIAYDCRHNSKSLALKVAEIFSANGIKVFIFF